MPVAEAPSPEAAQKEKPSASKYEVRWGWIIAGACLLAFGLLLWFIATLYYSGKIPFLKPEDTRVVSVNHPVLVSPAKPNRQSKKRTESNSGNSAASKGANPFVAATMMQTSPVFPQATPTPSEGKKKKKSVYRKFLNWLSGVCRWARLCKEKETPLINLPANVNSVTLDKRTVAGSCPTNYRPREGAVCSDDMSIGVSTSASDAENDELTYNYTVSGGRIVGTGANVRWDLSGVREGNYTITVGVVDDAGCGVCGKTVTETITVASCNCEPVFPPSPTPVPCDCPKLSITGPGEFYPGKTINFTADVSGNTDDITFYRWKVWSGGDIVSGQGTPGITVLVSESVGEIFVTLDVGFSGKLQNCNCPNSASIKLGGMKPPMQGRITGVIIDKNKKPRPGIKVILKSKSSGAVFEAVTDANGNYDFGSIPYDDYTMTTALDGETQTTELTVNGPLHAVNFDFSPPSPSPVPTLSPDESPTPTVTPTVTPTASPTPGGKTVKHDKIEMRYPERVLPDTVYDISFSLEDTPFPIKETNQTIPANAANNAIATNVNVIIRTGSTVSPRGTCENCRVYARPRLVSLKGLVVTEEAADPEREYDGQFEEWKWKVRTTLKEGETAVFKIQLDFELRSNTENESKPDYWKEAPEISVPVGLPDWIKLLSPASGATGMFGMGVGAISRKRRREDGAEEDSGETPDIVPPLPPDAGDEVHGTIYAPEQAKVGSNFLVQVFAHLSEHAGEIEKIVAARNPDAVEQDASVFEEPVERGAKLTFALRMPGMEADEPVQTYKWKGEPLEVEYIISVPKDYPLGESFGKVIISLDSVPIGRLSFTVDIVSAATELTQNPPVAGKMSFYQAAFISYASEDRPEVLKRVQMLNAQKIPFFQDMISLNPGDRWRKELYKNLDKCDVLYLFWSEAAAESEWVKKEVLYAYQLQAGKETAPPDIIPIPIEGPPPVAPPEELNFLHFNDVFIYLIYAAEAEKKIKEN